MPSLVTAAVLPRWWQVSPNELHAVAAYQEFGEDLMAAAVRDAGLRGDVLAILTNRMLSRRSGEAERILVSGNEEAARHMLAPAEAFYLATQYRQQHAADITRRGKTGEELARLAQDDPVATNPAKISEDFGVPHPILAQTNARELLNLRPFPTFLGYSSYLLAECWESNNLYWARLAYEKGVAPESLHQLVPALTHRMVENIFATHLDDWPALLRALRETGEEYRHGKIESVATVSALSLQ